MRGAVALTLLSLLAAGGFAVSPVTASICPGDCDGDVRVAIGEIVRGTRIFLDKDSRDSCVAIDVDRNLIVTVEEVILAVRAGLEGCPLCGNGLLEPGEECEAGDPSVRCYSDCTICCKTACPLRACCLDGPEGELVPVERACGHECYGPGEPCSSIGISFFGCCEPWTKCGGRTVISFDVPPIIQGTCCPRPGSPCSDDEDCCGADFLEGPEPQRCVDSKCCIPRSAQCSREDAARSPCCEPGDQCVSTANGLRCQPAR